MTVEEELKPGFADEDPEEENIDMEEDCNGDCLICLFQDGLKELKP